MKEKKIIYEPHPVSAERKAELVKQGYKILDKIFDPNPEPEKKQSKSKAAE
jgi:hypothetical protein